MNRFLAEIGLSKDLKHSILIYQRTDNLTKCFKFKYKRTTCDGEAYVCIGCCQLKKKQGGTFSILSISVSKDKRRFLANPESLNHACINNDLFVYDYLSVGVNQVLRQVKEEVKERGTKPALARKTLTDRIEITYPESTADAMLTLPNRKAKDRSFQRARKEFRNADVDPLNIPKELYLSTVVVNGRRSNVVRFYSDFDPPFVLLADRTNLKAIHDARILVMDGTFKYRPQGFAQTYTIHSVFADLPDKQSSFISAIAFLPDKSQETYVDLLEALRDCLLDEFKGIGPDKLVLIDQEAAVHNSINRVFPTFETRSCNFHFAKNIQDYAKNNGLAAMLTDENFSTWLNAIIGSVFLPPNYIHVVFDYLLDNSPFENTTLVNYLRNYWKPRLNKVCTWDGEFPRTTNVAEGYHHAMQTSFDHEEHPQFRKAFDVHVSDLSESAYDYLRLDSKVDGLRLREPKYRRIDKKISDAKRQLNDYLSLNNEFQMEHLLRFCRHMRFLTNSDNSENNQNHPDAMLDFGQIEFDEEIVPNILPLLIPVRTRKKRPIEVEIPAPMIRRILPQRATNQRVNYRERGSSEFYASDESNNFS